MARRSKEAYISQMLKTALYWMLKTQVKDITMGMPKRHMQKKKNIRKGPEKLNKMDTRDTF